MSGLVLNKLQEGGRLNLSKVAQDNNIGLSKLMVGLGWDENQSGSGYDFDADVSLAFLSANGKCSGENRFLFYNTPGMKLINPATGEEYAVHSGDNRTGEGEGDDESVALNLDRVPADVEEIAIYVTIHDAIQRGQNFGMLDNSFIRIFDVTTEKVLLQWDLDFDASTADAVKFGSLIRRQGEWHFKAIRTIETGGLAGITSRIGF